MKTFKQFLNEKNENKLQTEQSGLPSGSAKKIMGLFGKIKKGVNDARLASKYNKGVASTYKGSTAGRTYDKPAVGDADRKRDKLPSMYTPMYPYTPYANPKARFTKDDTGMKNRVQAEGVLDFFQKRREKAKKALKQKGETHTIMRDNPRKPRLNAPDSGPESKAFGKGTLPKKKKPTYDPRKRHPKELRNVGPVGMTGYRTDIA